MNRFVTLEDRCELRLFEFYLAKVTAGSSPQLAYAEVYGELVFHDVEAERDARGGRR